VSLLAAKTYDPAVAVNKVTTALLPMTALDTTELRLTFNAPANGAVLVRMQGVVHGATTWPSLLFGVMEGASVTARVAPRIDIANAVATMFGIAEALFVVPNLVPAQAYTWDAAYGVETLAATTGIKYGGPNDGTGNNAFGAFLFEVWTT
jgi:hypothetical protein